MALEKIREAWNHAKQLTSQIKNDASLRPPIAFTPLYAGVGVASAASIKGLYDFLPTHPELVVPLEMLTAGVIGLSFLYTGHTLATKKTCVDANSVFIYKFLEHGPSGIVEKRLVKEVLPYIAVAIAAMIDLINPADPSTDFFHGANFNGDIHSAVIGKYLGSGGFNLGANWTLNRFGDRAVNTLQDFKDRFDNAKQSLSLSRRLPWRRSPQSVGVPPVTPSVGASEHIVGK